MPRLFIALKMLTQFGIQPLAAYARYRFGLLTGHYRRLDPRLRREAVNVKADFNPVFVLPSRADLPRMLGPAGRARLSRAADEIVAGKLRFFEATPIPLKLTSSRRLHHWTAYELDQSLISDLRPPFNDVKFLWEPARFGWAFNLGRAFVATGSSKYAAAFWKHFEAFDRANPPFIGPHWMNGQEVAIRLMAMLWSAHVFRQARASTTKRVARLTRSIVEHAARIPPTLSYARSQDNNHVITECTALYVAGVAFEHARWREHGWRGLNRALLKQIGSDGEYVQHSTNYHRLMLQSVLIADAARRSRGDIWPAATQRALARATQWLLALLDPASGRVPNLGANDGALILPLTSSAFDDYRPTVQAAARAFLTSSLPQGDWDETSLWLGLPATNHKAEATAYAAEHLRDRNSWTYLRASQFRSRLGHMDQLQVDLWWRGTNITMDAGTYLYSAPPPWDNPLVTARVHNTVTIDDRDQMTHAGRFMVLDWFPAWTRLLPSPEPPSLRQITAGHRSYDRLGVRHSRTVGLLPGARWQVTDTLGWLSPGSHTVRLHWLLLDGEWRLEQHGWETRLRIRLPRGRVLVSVTAVGGITGSPRATLIRAGKVLKGTGTALPFEGWISPNYGLKSPALSLAVEVGASESFSLRTILTLPD